MRPFARLLFFLILSAVSCQLSVVMREAHAQGEFTTDYKVNYAVESTGRTNVTQQIVLRNKTANFYADKFELKIGSTKVENVKAQDASGPMETTVKFDNNVTSISVEFNQRVIGIDKTLPWTLSYTSTELASKSGQIWELSIPKVAQSTDIGTYDAQVTVPATFGPLAATAPEPKTTSSTSLLHTFTFDRDQLTKSGIAMSFGEKQVFAFNLNYYLENQNLTTQIQEITLPPDNNYQKIVLEKIDPSPIDVTVDADGNFLAKYKLAPKQKIDVNAAGYVEVFSKPFRNIYKPLSQSEKDRYTQPQRYWETDNAFVRDKANELKTPEKIYEFVASYLTYSQDRLNDPKIERKGAAQSAIEPQDAVCMEFTDLFIAIARSAKIPTREVEGYAYTQNERLRPLSLREEGDVLHAWPEYWDNNLGWVQIDPTWASTSGGLDFFNKMDFNHVTFIQRGTSSQSPQPPGAYKRQGDEQKKGVLVSFAQDLPQPTSIPQLTLYVPDKIISGIPVVITGQIKNAGSTSLFSVNLQLSTDLRVRGDKVTNLGIMPPYSQREIEYRLQTKGFFTTQTEPITLIYADKFISKSTSIIPIYFLLISVNFVIGTILAVVIIVAGYYLYKRFHHKKA